MDENEYAEDVSIIRTDDLTKIYRGGTLAVDHINFQVNPGEIFGFLGPNGAGKSTTIMMLTTLIRPTSGTARVCGFDIRTSPHKVRYQLGYVSQDVAVDDNLTGRENLVLQGKLYHLPNEVLRRRIDEVLGMVELSNHADKLVSTYSGGMRKRLDIAAGLIHTPRLLFLDEPTLGLDIQTRARIWEYIRWLRDEHNITIFLTTHYMEEADRLCDRVAIIDMGRIAALDSPSALKASLGGDVVTLRIDGKAVLNGELLEKLGSLPFVRSTQTSGDGAGDAAQSVHLTVEEGEKVAPRLLDFLAEQGVRVESMSLKRPSLDDVFMCYTGRELRQDQGSDGFWRMAMAVRRMRR